MTVDTTLPHAGRDLRIACACCTIVFLALLIWLHDAPVLLPHQGRQGLRAAAALVEGRGFEVHPGTPYVKFGPLYPGLLASLGWAGLEPVRAAYVLNCSSFAATLFVVYLLCRRIDVAPLGSAVAAVFVGLMAANVYLLRAVRADSLAILASLLAIAATASYARRPSSRALWGAAVGCAIAATARYMALFTILPVTAFAILRFAGRRSRMRDGLVFGVVAVGPVALWLIRNLKLSGYATGMSRLADRQQAAETGLVDNATALLTTVYVDLFSFSAMGVRAVVQAEVPLAHPVLTAAMAIAAGGLLAAFCWKRYPDIRSVVADHWPGRGGVGELVGAYVVAYTIALLVLWTVGNNDPIHTRFVAPLYPCAVVLGFGLAAALGRIGISSTERIALVLFVLLIAAPNAVKSIRLLGDHPEESLIETQGRNGQNFWNPGLRWDDLGRS